MNRSHFIFTLIFLSVISISTFAQNPTPTPPPLPEDDGEVVKISTTLIQLDVVVTDKKGNQVTDLKPEDFEIFVNGEKQDITNFSYIFSKNTKPENEEKNTDKNNKSNKKYSVPPPPSKLKLENIQRTYAIVVDDLGLAFPSIPKVKRSIKNFINEQMEEGDLVAIVRTGSGIGALQSFTTDKRQLLAAVDKIKWNPQGRGDIGYFSPILKTLKQEKEAITGESVEGGEEEELFKKNVEEFRNENFSIGTLGGLNYVIRGMRELPGRKAVMLFSEGFVLTSDGVPNNVFQAMRRLADIANRSTVVIYTLDPRGLQNPDMFNAEDNVSDPFPGSTANLSRESRVDKFRQSQQSLRYLAYETGGFPFVNQNDLNVGMREVVEDQSGYYLLGYQPDEATFDPQKAKFNKVSIKVNRDDIKVRYRSGFFGITDQKIVASNNKTAGQQIYGALLSPFGSNDISLSLNTLFAGDPKNGTFIRSLVTIEAKDLNFTKEADGTYKANFDILAMTFGDNGTPIDETAKNYTIRLGEKAYQNVLEKGFIYNLLVPIKKAGAYQFRVALRDSATARVGSASQFIEVPNLKKKRLTLSSLVLDNYTLEQWQKISSGKSPSANDTDFDIDTALRRFKRGTVLRYDYIIYNAKANPANLEVRARLYFNGELIIEGEPSSIETKGQTDLNRIETAGAIKLGNNLKPGDYVFQIIVTDKRAKEKHQTTSRWVDFEVVE